MNEHKKKNYKKNIHLQYIIIIIVRIIMHVIDVVIFDMQIQTFFMRQGMDVFLVCYLDQFM